MESGTRIKLQTWITFKLDQVNFRLHKLDKPS